MKHEFIMTDNYKRAFEAVCKLERLPANIPKMALFYGKPGEGKTLAIEKLAVEKGITLLRTLGGWSPKEMMIDICNELGLDCSGSIATMQRRVIDYLQLTQTILMIDEIDTLFSEGKKNSLIVLRDLHDKACTPIIFVGMENCKRRFQKDKYYYRRFSQRIEFTQTTLNDTKALCSNSDVQIEDDLIQYFYNKYDFGDLVVLIDMLEEHCEKKDIEVVDLRTFHQTKVEKSYEV